VQGRCGFGWNIKSILMAMPACRTINSRRHNFSPFVVFSCQVESSALPQTAILGAWLRTNQTQGHRGSLEGHRSSTARSRSSTGPTPSR
jgi:hypothetical protein